MVPRRAVPAGQAGRAQARRYRVARRPPGLSPPGTEARHSAGAAAGVKKGRNGDPAATLPPVPPSNGFAQPGRGHGFMPTRTLNGAPVWLPGLLPPGASGDGGATPTIPRMAPQKAEEGRRVRTRHRAILHFSIQLFVDYFSQFIPDNQLQSSYSYTY